MGLGKLGGIRVGGNRAGAGFSMRPRYTTHHDNTVGRAPPRQLLGKRCAFKGNPAPPCSFMPKTLPIRIHSPSPELSSASISMEKHIPPKLYRTVNSAKKLFLPSTLTAEAILTLQEENEGRLHWSGVSPEEVGRWERNHPEVIEHDEIRQEYNFLNGRFIIKCAPTPTHESFSEFFMDTLGRSLNKLVPKESGKMVKIGSARGM